MKVTVKNRSDGMVVYSVPTETGINIRREFMPGESRNVDSEELERLTYREGGRELLRDYLQIEDDGIVSSLLSKVEPEYWMSEKDVKKLLETGTLDELLDCLDFAPEGILDLVKKYAVTMPLNDNTKRDAIKRKLGFDVSKAIELERQANEPEEKDSEATTIKDEKVRRTIPSTNGRRTTTPKYNVVSKKEV